MKPDNKYRLIIVGFILLTISCNVLASQLVPTSAPPTPTLTPIPLSQQVTLIPQLFEETNQTPPFTIKLQTPQLVGSDDSRVIAFNQQLNELVTTELNTWRESFMQNTGSIVSSGSFLETTYTQASQINELWSLKFDFNFYSAGAAHPGSYSITMNYDLGQGWELALGDLFIPNSNYLEVISNYCIVQLSKQPFFDSEFTTGADPTQEYYQNWNITPKGLLITFDEYQVAPYAAGPQQVLVPYSELQTILDPQGPLAAFTH